MIKGVKLINFKCFEDLEVGIAPLNCLCGLNGMGKSSLIQALLVLKQSFESGDLLAGRLLLGGELADLGTGVDLLFENAAEDSIGLGIKADWDGESHEWGLSFDYQRDADQLLARPLRHHRPPSFVPMPWRTRPPFGGPFSYVSADRVGPQKLYALSKSRARDKDVGVRGEFAVNTLLSHASDLFEAGDPRVKGEDSNRLIEQVNAWLDVVSPGVKVELEAILSADAAILGYSFAREGDVPSRRYRATNVGFGLSYVLPVVMSLLTAQRGGLVVIENPEAHLHPQGQTKLAELAVRAMMAGVQIFVETHSDHFIDGVRICVRNQLVSPADVAFHYFRRESNSTIVQSPTLDSDGRLSSWPEGFFDQHDLNLAKLLAPRR